MCIVKISSPSGSIGEKSAIAEAGAMLWLTDKDGRQIGVPSAKVAYVDIGAQAGGPRIGFGA